MKLLLLISLATLLLSLGGCTGMGRDPAIVGRRTTWFERTDPERFFAQERRRGLIYFIGIYDPQLKAKSPAPGVPPGQAQLANIPIWFVPSGSIADPAENRRFLEAARQFALRYNPLVVAYLRRPPPHA